MVEISAGQAGVWGVNIENEVYYRKGTYGGAVRFVEIPEAIIFLSISQRFPPDFHAFSCWQFFNSLGKKNPCFLLACLN